MALRVFIDANVLIAGADSRSGASHAVLRLTEIGLIDLVVSQQVLDETERILRRKLPRALPAFAAEMAQLSLEILPDPPEAEYIPYTNIIEPGDAPILAAAVGASVSRFLTLNTRHFTPYVADQAGLVIQTPGEFIQQLRGLIGELSES